MANEYLKRTPTSTGNRIKGTWSFWVKRSVLNGGSSAQYLFYASGGSGADATRFNDDDGGDSLRSFFWNGSTNGGFINFDKMRDISSWQHYLVVYDSSLNTNDNMSNNDQTLERIKIFVNGRRMIETGGNSVQNSGILANQLMTHWGNTGVVNHLFGEAGGSTQGKLYTMDNFFVDGQALTPDVFGFYKDGDGYISAGHTKATDFRPGQWSPRLPKSIKHTINRSGGFGVNGFYLPMNDSSNPGADFHCAPNSIITLKGEDLPQPRNGAPTTTDAYVSQLRSDPFAANLILACPFVADGFGQDGAVSSTIPGLGDYHIALGGPSSIPAVNFLIGASGNQAKITGDKGLYYGSSLDVSNSSINPRATVGTAFTPDGDYTVEFWAYQNDLTDVGGAHVLQYDSDAGQTGWLISSDVGTFRWTLRNSSNQDVSVSTPNVVQSGQWNHFAGVYESSKNLMTAYLNGVAVGSTPVASNYLSTQYTNLNRIHIGSNGGGGSRPMLGYMQDLRIYKGVAKYTGGFDVPKPYTPVGIEPFRTTADTCKNNFATLNSLYLYGNSATSFSSNITLKDGNLTAAWTSGAGSNQHARSNFGMTSGKWYFETRMNALTGGDLGVVFENHINDSVGFGSDQLGFSYRSDGQKQNSSFSGFGGAFDTGDILGCAYDADAGSIQFYRNGTSQGTAFTGISIDQPAFFGVGKASSGATMDASVNFGQNQTFGNRAAVNNNRVNNGTGNDVWHQSSNGGTHVDWTVSSGGTAMSVNVPSGNYARAWLLASDGTIDPKKTYLLSFKYVTGPSNLGVQNDQGYMTAVDGSASPSGLSSGNYYSFIIQGTREFNFTGFSGSNYSLDEIVVSEIDECYTDTSGKGKFHYEPPTGFLSLCEDNLPAPAIADPGEHFKCVLWTGSGGSKAITGVGFKPDLVWVKSRTNTEGHILFDSVRGPNVRQLVHTNTTEATAVGGLNSFDDDGFSVGQYTGTNQSGQDYVAWCWKAGGAAVSNTDGTITSQVSVNQTAGFSVGTFSGNLQANQSIGHGLGKVPAMVVVKERNANSGWAVYHKARGNTKVSYWDIPNTEFTESGNGASWGPTDPTSDVFYVGANGATNDNNLAFYAWAEIENFSKFGSYIGNQSGNGPVIDCGFKPAFLMLKLVTGQDRDWHIYDSSRNPTNPVGLNLRPSNDSADTDEPGIDFLSNGFKIRQNYIFSNENTQTIIFAAFAESPFQTANAK